MTNWATALFEDIVIDETGGNIKIPQSEFALTGKYPIIDQGRRFIAGYTNTATRLCKVVEPVVVFGDHTRALKYVDFPFCLGADGTKILRPKHGTDAKFLYHYLRTVQLPEAGYSRHYKFLKRLSVPTPPINDQRRIATILDEADALRAKRRAALAQLDEMTQAIFVEMFGDPSKSPGRWKSADLKNLITPGDNINYGVIQPGDDHPGGVGLIRVSDISEGRVDKRNLKSISPKIERQYKRSRLIGDEVLLSCVGSVGQLALATPDEAGLNIARAIARIRVAPDLIRREFLIAYLKADYVQEYFKKELRTVSQPTLNIKQIGETPTWLPPLSRQDDFVEAMLLQEKLKLTMRSMLREMDTLFASLQHRAFTGAL